MERDPAKERIAKFRMDLESQYRMFKDKVISAPKRSLMARGYKFYSQFRRGEEEICGTEQGI
jgi:hypothetical protein